MFQKESDSESESTEASCVYNEIPIWTILNLTGIQFSFYSLETSRFCSFFNVHQAGIKKNNLRNKFQEGENSGRWNDLESDSDWDFESDSDPLINKESISFQNPPEKTGIQEFESESKALNSILLAGFKLICYFWKIII